MNNNIRPVIFHPKFIFLFQWILYSVIASLIFTRLRYEIRSTSILSIIIKAALISSAQWVALNKSFGRARQWAKITFFGLLFINGFYIIANQPLQQFYQLFDLENELVFMLLFSLIAAGDGFIIGVLQAYTLRIDFVPRAIFWPLTTGFTAGIAYLFSFTMIDLVYFLPYFIWNNTALTDTISTIMISGLTAFLTGIVLTTLLHHEQNQVIS